MLSGHARCSGGKSQADSRWSQRFDTRLAAFVGWASGAIVAGRAWAVGWGRRRLVVPVAPAAVGADVSWCPLSGELSVHHMRSVTSFLLFRGMGTLVAKPADQRVPLSPEAARYIQRGSLGIVGDPVQISPAVEEVFRRPALSTGAGMPEGLRELAGFRGRPLGE